jgi:uncharacterized FlgJ-related protein
MNIIFIIYTLLVITTIAILYLAFSYTVLKKKLGIRQWCLILCGAISISIFEGVAYNGMEVNNKMRTEFKIPKDFYSPSQYVNDSTIDDATLYNRILLMRANFPKVILCQAKIESSDYKSALYKRNNNLFGMKISTGRVTTANSGGSDSEGRAGYKSYSSWTLSLTDYILWQLSHQISNMSQDEYITFLGRIYAEDPKYSSKIRAMMNKIDFKSLENNFESN